MSDPFSGAGGFDPGAFGDVPLFRELMKVLSWTGGPVNWDLARETAQSVVASGAGRRAVGAGADADALAEAVRVAELWLDAVVTLPAVDGPVRTLTELEWVQLAARSDGLGVYVEPVAEGMAAALAKGLPEQLADPDSPLAGELGGLLGGLPAGGLGGLMGQALGPLGAMLYGAQVGTIAGHLAGQLQATSDLGLPLIDPRTIATVGDGARRFAQQHDVDEVEHRYWLALREAVHRRLFAGVPWLRSHVGALLRRFAEAADFDPTALLDQLGGMGLDPQALSDPAALERALASGEAALQPTPAQQEALAGLQALVAVAEGYRDTAVRRAGARTLPSLGRLEEAMLRRRAEAGPGEQALQSLLGLDLRPADVRQGTAFCEAVLSARGPAGLDLLWARPERLPSAAELADPSRWLLRLAAEDPAGALDGPPLEVDVPDDLAALDDLLRGDDGDDDPGPSPMGPPGA